MNELSPENCIFVQLRVERFFEKSPSRSDWYASVGSDALGNGRFSETIVEMRAFGRNEAISVDKQLHGIKRTLLDECEWRFPGEFRLSAEPVTFEHYKRFWREAEEFNLAWS